LIHCIHMHVDYDFRHSLNDCGLGYWLESVAMLAFLKGLLEIALALVCSGKPTRAKSGNRFRIAFP
jgi:hypothetical protein